MPLQDGNTILLCDANTISLDSVNVINLFEVVRPEKWKANKESTIVGGRDNLKSIVGRDSSKKVGGSGGLR